MNDAATAEPVRRHGALRLLRAVPTGISQVYLQESVPAGVLFLVALLLSGPQNALAALLGSTAGLLTALALRVPPDRISQGLFGFNGTLVVLGAVTSFRSLGLALLVGIVGAVLATVLARVADFFLTVPARTAPFVITYWLTTYLGHRMGWEAASTASSAHGDYSGLFGSAAEVFLVTGALPGLFMFAGLLVAGWRLAVAALGASAAALVVVELVPLFPHDDISAGVYGFNAALVAVGMLTTGRTWRSCLLAVPAVLLLQAGLEAVHLVPTTCPFVLAMWVADLHFQRSGRTALP
ncbi:urea transporter [Saccharopolyspora rosea]|uniref:Urea transporter n=1 Tax=Saccharopolyspora rosea TaxID=524884 RepID=A0ABW3FKI3_9PSEU|nr:urea transporter [Saccharopolyspora rosea]